MGFEYFNKKQCFEMGLVIGGICNTTSKKVARIEGVTKFSPRLCATFFPEDLIYDTKEEVVLTTENSYTDRNEYLIRDLLKNLFKSAYNFTSHTSGGVDSVWGIDWFSMEENSQYTTSLTDRELKVGNRDGSKTIATKTISKTIGWIEGMGYSMVAYTPILYKNDNVVYIAGYPESLSFKYANRWYSLQSPYCTGDIPLDTNPVSGLSSNYAIELNGYIHTTGLTVQKTYRVRSSKTKNYRLIVALNSTIGVIIE